MEWTLDQERLHENPLMTTNGRKNIISLCQTFDIKIPTLTADCFMQAPFYKATGLERRSLLDDALKVIEACLELNIEIVVMPLVDNGRIENTEQEDALFDGLEQLISGLKSGRIRVAFESDFPPVSLAELLSRLDQNIFGINYDVGNSAALGYNYREEIKTYGKEIIHVHVKDRIRNGGTVPLGQGAADLTGCIHMLQESGYDGVYMLQTARATDGNHAAALCKYRDMVVSWLEGGG